MKFCDVCDNMLYIKLENDAPAQPSAENHLALVYFCKNCGNSIKGNDTDTKSCIMDTNYVDNQTSYKQFATPFITHDPTLPRVNNIACPNATCSKPADKEADVIFVKYDFANLKFLYHCTYCSTFWKSGDAASSLA